MHAATVPAIAAPATRIAVVEDMAELRDDVVFHLRHAGYQVDSAGDGQALSALLPRFAPDIVVLDVGLPGEDGLQIAGRLRAQQPDIGIVMLTGRSALHERLAGRRQGADHYLAKPVQIDELVLVVRSLARRITARAPAAWTVSPQRLQLQAPSGATVAITQSESALLAALARAPQRQCSRRALAQALGESWEAYDERRLEALVSRLRRKLADGCGCEAPLRTLRGSGYGFVEPLQLG